MKKIVISTLLIVVLFGSSAVSDNFFNISKNIEIFTTLYREVNSYYVDDIDASKFIRTGINAMLGSLDPYTNFYSESQVEDYRFETTGQYGGIGAVVARRDSQLVVTETLENFPAQKSDLRVGDVLIEINGESTKGRSAADISKFLKGQAGTTIELKLLRPGQVSPLNLAIEREEIQLSSVPFYGMLSSDVGFIYLDGFKSDSYRELNKAYGELESQGMKKLVLDLRGNPGGLLDQAVSISGMFIPRGSLVVETKGKAEKWNVAYKTRNSPRSTSIPIAVLINGSSASASEIVSGVLQDYDRAVIIGRQSFGKGLVQTVRPLNYNTQVKVTTAKYYTPSGRCIQRINYTDRVDGKAQDYSNRKKFKTAVGRIVYDSEGVEPDLSLEKPILSSIAKSLLQKGIIFDFANHYRNTHTEIAEAKDFSIDDDIYGKFAEFVRNSEHTYKTESEEYLESCLNAAKEEGYYEHLQEEMNTLNKKLQSHKSQDLETNKPQISLLLESEIVGRYHFKDGELEASFDNDKTILKAIEILDDQEEYKRILSVSK